MVTLHLTQPITHGVVRLLLAEGKVTAGCSVVGGSELFDRLELELGLPPLPEFEHRVMTLLSRDGATGDDPVGHALERLRLADTLQAHGVTAATLPRRWHGLLAAAMAVGGGPADRFTRLQHQLRVRPTCGKVLVHAPIKRLPVIVQRTLHALAERGWEVHSTTPETPPRTVATIALVRGHSPRDVAASVARHLARTHCSHAVWIAPQPIVDHALSARGLPRIGAGAPHPPFLGVLGRVVALAFAPQHPADLLDLLTAPHSQLPLVAAKRLCAALQDWPSWRTPEWTSACDAVIAQGEAPRRSIEWLAACLRPLGDHDADIETDALRARVAALADVLRADADADRTDAVAACARFGELLDLHGARCVRRDVAEGLVRLIEARLPRYTTEAPEVGSLALPALSSVIGPVERLIVWDARPPYADPIDALLPSERRSLNAVGAKIPDPRARLMDHFEDLRLAVARTTREVLLCLPAHDEEGAPVRDPDWLRELDVALRAEGSRLTPLTEPERAIERAITPGRTERWEVPPGSLEARAQESPTSVMNLLGCSLRHALQHQARLPPSFAPELAAEGLLHGRLAHRVFDAVWHDPTAADASPDAVSDLFRTTFDATVGVYAPPLAASRAHGFQVREVVARAGRALARSLRGAGTHVAGCEVALGDGLTLGETRIAGRADLILGPAPVVLDLKWSGALHPLALAQGSAVQIALYAWMLRGGDRAAAEAPWPGAGYLIATRAAIFITPGAPLADARPVAGPALADTVRAVQKALLARREEAARGALFAPGVATGERPRPGLREGTLTLDPPCLGCPYGSLCGRSLER